MSRKPQQQKWHKAVPMPLHGYNFHLSLASLQRNYLLLIESIKLHLLNVFEFSFFTWNNFKKLLSSFQQNLSRFNRKLIFDVCILLTVSENTLPHKTCKNAITTGENTKRTLNEFENNYQTSLTKLSDSKPTFFSLINHIEFKEGREVLKIP